jgi:hypothetical protein
MRLQLSARTAGNFQIDFQIIRFSSFNGRVTEFSEFAAATIRGWQIKQR